jgi:Cu2+-exporting ATPase
MRRVVRQNLFWSAAYNFGALPLAAFGFIPPWLAAVGMSLSSVFVVLNAMRLLPKRAASSLALPVATPGALIEAHAVAGLTS